MAGGGQGADEELRETLADLREGQRQTVDGLHVLSLAVARLEERFTGHVAAQLDRTRRRDERCAEHLGLIRALDGRVGTVEGAASQDAGSRRSVSSALQTAGVMAALAGVAVALWRG